MNKIVALYFLINASKPKDTGYLDADHTSLQAPVEASGALQSNRGRRFRWQRSIWLSRRMVKLALQMKTTATGKGCRY